MRTSARGIEASVSGSFDVATLQTYNQEQVPLEYAKLLHRVFNLESLADGGRKVYRFTEKQIRISKKFLSLFIHSSQIQVAIFKFTSSNPLALSQSRLLIRKRCFRGYLRDLDRQGGTTTTLRLQVRSLLLPARTLPRLRVDSLSLPAASTVWLRLSTIVLRIARLCLHGLILAAARLELFFGLRFLTTAAGLELVGCAAWVCVVVLASIPCKNRVIRQPGGLGVEVAVIWWRLTLRS